MWAPAWPAPRPPRPCAAKASTAESVLIGDEPTRPYERPPLSKDYLRGETDFDGAAVHPADFYDSHGIDLRMSTTVTAIDPTTSEVELSPGGRLAYDRLLLSTGAAPRRLSVPGSTLPGVRYLRTVADSDTLRHAITSADPVVVIGAGWIGSEVAASARQLGAEVAMVEVASVPLERVLGTEVGGIYRDLHAEHGVRLHLGVGVDGIGGADRVEEVRLSDGTVLPAGTVVVGVGVQPRTDLAQAAGLRLDDGVVTDEYLATSVPTIYAAGDVANVWYRAYGAHIRLEHWSAALNQGPAAAKNMLGHVTAYEKVPYFFSDQYDLGMESAAGLPASSRWSFGVILRAVRSWLAFWLAQGRVRAAMNTNIWDQGDPIEALIRSDRPVDPARLADPDIELSKVAPDPG